MKMLRTALSAAMASCLCMAAAHASTNCSAVGGNLVANCGFETGDFTSWTTTGNDVTNGQLGNLYGVEGTDPVDHTAPLDGSNQAYFGDLDANAVTIAQTISTIVGDTYTVSFYVAQDTTPSPGAETANELIASFGGASLASLSDVAVEPYTLYTYSAVASSTSSALDLTFGNGGGEFLLDDVSVVQSAAVVAAAPEPSSLALLVVPMAGLLYAHRRKFGFSA